MLNTILFYWNHNGLVERVEPIICIIFIIVCRFKVFKSAETYDSSRYSAILKYLEDFKLHQISSTGIDFHFCLVDGCWHHPFGECSPKVVTY